MTISFRGWPVFVVLFGLAEATRGEGETVTAASPGRVDFGREIRPLLEQNCLKCHGAEKRKGGLRLTARKDALHAADSGEPAIVPGQGAESELIRRVTSDDELERMPPEGEPLTAEQVRLLRDWIDQGADWPDSGPTSQHWAYAGPIRPQPPEVRDASWPINPIDRFVLARLEAEGLAPAPSADRARLIRRVSLDLMGLPPTVQQVEAFLDDDRPDAYERVVDGLLASPRYGERRARAWLDLARYADSNGFQRDGFRDAWAYRDWVVRAFNADMPFDTFTIEQIAGDLLPGATTDQKVATGFHRGPTVNVEAGVDQEENRINAVIDRVNTTATVWLGSTIGCAQCHNHKYDPFTQKEYYQLFAYFNNTAQETTLIAPGGDSAGINFIGPTMELSGPPDARGRREALQRRHEAVAAEVAAEQDEWECRMREDGERSKALPAAIRKILDVPDGRRTPAQKKALSKHFLAATPELKEAGVELAAIEKELEASKPPTTLVMVEMDRARETRVFLRGNFLDKGAEVRPGVPEVLHPLPADAPPDRVGLARWLVDPRNPLVGRVTVNRWWAEFFGRGLVASPEDFGIQGEPPTHPGLLDWLATEFVDCGWSMKAIHRLIVTSATYRQSSRVGPDQLERDPGNALYARGPRVRLDAETIRDNALAISGLLSPKAGGRPVFPPQPEGVWRVTGQVDNTYRTSVGEDRYRRGLYVVWRRSSPYPSFVNFDAPDRSGCVAGRPKSNTPLQALTLLNDPAYVEMAWALAGRIVRECRARDIPDRAAYGFRLCLARHPGSDEVAILSEACRSELARFRADPTAARKLVGGVPIPEGSDAAELAAWFALANMLLNLDETITKG